MNSFNFIQQLELQIALNLYIVNSTQLITNLRFDDHFLHSIRLQPGNVNSQIGVTDIAEDRVFLHLHEMAVGDDALTASSRYDNTGFLHSLVHGGHFIT